MCDALDYAKEWNGRDARFFFFHGDDTSSAMTVVG